MLKMTKIKFELIQHPDFVNSTRGGVSNISNWYNEPNNKYLKSYDPKQE